MGVARAVRDWLHMVAGHVGFDECVAAAVETLSTGIPLAFFGCNKCGATHLDANKFATKLHSHHVCAVCNHHWIKQPAVVGVRFKLTHNSIQSKPMSPRHWYRTTRLI